MCLIRAATTSLRGSSDDMEHETLFTASKWDILKHLERGPASPLELSRRCNTSIANISQQLRLLEMAGLVAGKRVSNRDKGKPRILYGLAGNLSYLIATSGDFVEKKLLELSEYNKIIMRIWFWERRDLHYAAEKAFWRIEEHLPRISLLALSTAPGASVTFHVRFTGAPADLAPFFVACPDGTTRQVTFDTHAPLGGAYVLYDPQGLALEQRGDGNE